MPIDMDDDSAWMPGVLEHFRKFGPNPPRPINFHTAEADEPVYDRELPGFLYEADLEVRPNCWESHWVTEEQHRFIVQYEEARERQKEAESNAAAARWKPPPPPPPEPEPEPEEIPPEGRLTPRQEEFCRHYAAQPVATRAAALAGYAADFAKNQGYRLLKNPLVLDRIAQLRADGNLVYALDRDTLHDKLEALFFDALGERNHAAAVAALRLQAGLAGMMPRAAASVRRAQKPAARRNGARRRMTTDDDK